LSFYFPRLGGSIRDHLTLTYLLQCGIASFFSAMRHKKLETAQSTPKASRAAHNARVHRVGFQAQLRKNGVLRFFYRTDGSAMRSNWATNCQN